MMTYQRGPYLCAAFAPEDPRLAHLSPEIIRQAFGSPCPGCGCYHPCDTCGNYHCGCPDGRACPASARCHDGA